MGRAELDEPSACSQWSTAQVLSHLGSQAEIFSLLVNAGLSGGEPPSQASFGPIWDKWNVRSPEDQAAEAIAANQCLVVRLESLDAEALDRFRLEMFGRTLDAAGMLRMRLSEHAVHTWDVAVAFDPSAEVAAEAVELLIDGLGETAAHSGKAPGELLEVSVVTTAPERSFSLRTTDEVRLTPNDPGDRPGSSIELPAEAFLRLVYGRLDDAHPARGAVRSDGVGIAELVKIFQGF